MSGPGAVRTPKWLSGSLSHHGRRATPDVHQPLVLTQQKDRKLWSEELAGQLGSATCLARAAAGTVLTRCRGTAWGQEPSSHPLLSQGLGQAADLPRLYQGPLWGVSNKLSQSSRSRRSDLHAHCRVSLMVNQTGTQTTQDHSQLDCSSHRPPPCHFPAESHPFTHIQAYLPIYPPDKISDTAPKEQGMSPSPP